MFSAHVDRFSNTPLSTRASRFSVDSTRQWESRALSRVTAVPRGSGTPFQQRQWLEVWYTTLATTEAVEPLIVTVSDRATGELALTLWLITRIHNHIRIVEFADLGVTDYNAPLLGPAAPSDAIGAAELWDDLRRALRGNDLICLWKMPMEIDGRPNPLALLDRARAGVHNGNVVTVSEDFNAYRHSLARTVRKELERSWRVFTRHPGATFRVIVDVDEALRTLAVLEAHQGERMRDLGSNFFLNEANYAAFYRDLVRHSVSDGYVVMTALTCGHEIVATLLGIRTGTRYVMLRHSHAGERWSNCSPGRLIVERTMARLHQEGVRDFDFGRGNYALKRRFGAKRFPLTDITAALRWRGLPDVARDHAVRWLLRYPALVKIVRAAMGKPTLREEP